jgi:hypothetical protein
VHFIDFNGDYHMVTAGRGVEVRGVIGLLYTKQQYLALNKTCVFPELENAAAEFAVELTAVRYADKEAVMVKRFVTAVEFSTSPPGKRQQDCCLVVRTDSTCYSALVALNSSHKFYCQLLLVSTSTGAGTSTS